MKHRVGVVEIVMDPIHQRSYFTGLVLGPGTKLSTTYTSQKTYCDCDCEKILHVLSPSMPLFLPGFDEAYRARRPQSESWSGRPWPATPSRLPFGHRAPACFQSAGLCLLLTRRGYPL